MLIRTLPFLVISLVLTYAAIPIARGTPVLATLGVDGIKPGMRGHGMTVFRGTKPERFDVEVIDVLHNFRPDQDLILVRTEHPVLERATTVAGMSGSPIYIDGKLIGAYAYGWAFGREPVAGVTPISNMLAELSRPLRPVGLARTGHPALEAMALRPHTDRGEDAARSGEHAPSTEAYRPDQPYTGERSHAFAALDRAAAQRPEPAKVGSLTLRASTPLLVGGLTDEVVGMLSRKLDAFNLDILQAGGGARPDEPVAHAALHARPGQPTSDPFVDGGALGIQLIRGDISATAVGTVTHVAGKRLVAFGHPMLNAGQLALPTATAKILHVLASDRRSFKIAEALEPVGTLVQDRQSTVVVDTTRRAPTIPMTIRVHGVEAPRTQWRVELASHRMLTPMLAFSAVASALGVTAGDQDDVMFDVVTTVDISDVGKVQVRDQGYSAAGAASGSALARLRLFDLMEVAYGNPFEPVDVRGIEIDLHLRYGRDVTEIVEAAVTSDEVDPGRELPVFVRLRPYAGRERVRVVRIPVPESAAGKEIEIEVQPGDAVAVEQPQPRSVQDLVRIVKSGHQSTQLAVSVKEPARGLSLRGHVVRALPGSALDALMLANSSERGAPFATESHHLSDVGHVLSGSAKLKVQVRETAL